MRLCVVSGTFHPEPGGPSTFLYRLLPELMRRGHTVHVVTYGERDYPTDYPYTVSRISRRQPIPFRLILMSLTILRVAREADVIFVSDYGLPVAVVNLFLRKPMVIRVVADFAWEFAQRHNWIPLSQTVQEFQTAPQTIRVWWLRWLQRQYLRVARQVIVPSLHVAQLVQNWGIVPTIIYNAVEPHLFENPTPSLYLNLSHPLLITVARLTPVKGVDVLLQALAYLQDFYPMAQLLIVGEGPAREALGDLSVRLGLVSSVHFTGALPLEQVASILKSSDIFVLGSRTEGLPHVVLEALAIGLPVVATHVGGTPEVVRHDENGLLVPPENPQALAMAVKQLLDDPAMMTRFKKAGMLTLQKFSWQDMVNSYVSLLERAK